MNIPPPTTCPTSLRWARATATRTRPTSRTTVQDGRRVRSGRRHLEHGARRLLRLAQRHLHGDPARGGRRGPAACRRAPSASWESLKLALMGSAEPKPAYDGRCLSGGRVNADLALDALGEEPGTLTGRVTDRKACPWRGCRCRSAPRCSTRRVQTATTRSRASCPDTTRSWCTHPTTSPSRRPASRSPRVARRRSTSRSSSQARSPARFRAQDGGAELRGLQVTAYADNDGDVGACGRSR